jgi:hypothetical protein
MIVIGARRTVASLKVCDAKKKAFFRNYIIRRESVLSLKKLEVRDEKLI